MKKYEHQIRVYYQESILNSLERIPFLKRFWTGHNFDHLKMNEYMGNTWEPRTSNHPFTSADINVLLQEAERRGDI